MTDQHDRLKDLRKIAPVTEEARLMLGAATALREAASLIEHTINTGITAELPPGGNTVPDRAHLEETSCVLTLMMCAGMLRPVDGMFAKVAESLARKRGV
jgi:hypothetical protein